MAECETETIHPDIKRSAENTRADFVLIEHLDSLRARQGNIERVLVDLTTDVKALHQRVHYALAAANYVGLLGDSFAAFLLFATPILWAYMYDFFTLGPVLHDTEETGATSTIISTVCLIFAVASLPIFIRCLCNQFNVKGFVKQIQGHFQRLFKDKVKDQDKVDYD